MVHDLIAGHSSIALNLSRERLSRERTVLAYILHLDLDIPYNLNEDDATIADRIPKLQTLSCWSND
jgi:hypothetical protein